MEFGVLGPLEVRTGSGVDARSIEIRRGLPRTLLTMLVLHAGETVSASRLADALWDDDPPRNPANALQIQISYLRKQLTAEGSLQPIITRPGGYSLNIEREQIDAYRFEQVVRATSRSTRTSRDEILIALGELDDALTLWRGDALADVTGEPFAMGEAARLQDLRLVALELRHELMLTLGRHHELVGELTAMVGEHPLRERLHEQLLVALYRSGRQSDALRAYDHTRTHLLEELGIDPGPRLQELQRQILAQDPSLSWTPSPDDMPATVSVKSESSGPDRTASRPTATIPIAVTALVGRDIELARIRKLLDRSRIVTLTGPAGTGKSRLALEVASARALEADVWFVDLAAVADPDVVAATVAAALAVPVAPGEDAVTSVASSLACRNGLLVLDTCEHVVGAASLLAGRILRQARDVRILTTSRRPLGITGEIAWPVPPLALAPPDSRSADAVAGYPAAELFVERASSVRPDFELTDANAADIAAICLALDGLPLAIELAAARADVLTPQAIRARLMNRFELLVDGSSDVSPRQQTLRAAIDWSVGLLDERQRVFFARLGVIAATFDLEAACAITASEPAETLSLLTALVRHSMVAVVGDDHYRLLDTLRAYALETLETLETLDADDARDRHADYHVGLAERAERGIQGAEQLLWLDRLRTDVPDHRAALEWLVGTGDGMRAARLAGALGWFWTLDGMLAEACSRLEQVLAFQDLAPAVRGKATWSLALLSASLGGLEQAQALAAESIELGRLSGDLVVTGCGLNARAVAEWALGDFDASNRTRDDAIAAFTAADHEWGLALCRVLQARTAIDQGDPQATTRAEDGLEAARATGDLHLVGLGLEQVTRLALRAGEIETANARALESVTVQERVGYTEGVIAALHLLGRATLAAGDAEAAATHHRRALRLALTIGHAAAMCEALEDLAHASAIVDPDDARSLLHLAEHHRSDRSLPRRPDDDTRANALRLQLGTTDPRRDFDVPLEEAVRCILQSTNRP
ncbi:MAG: BTAD domain-containing putative transcriptional regulator [Acidimicrobiales bacterium]|nr:BTAD domain-containing putative transcriptional regulator [Acidimicrobiales bacterium]